MAIRAPSELTNNKHSFNYILKFSIFSSSSSIDFFLLISVYLQHSILDITSILIALAFK